MRKTMIYAFFLTLLFIINIQAMENEVQSANLPIYDTLTVEGEFVKHQFHNKAGRLIEGAYDLFFKTADEETFVKSINCQFPEGELKDNFNKLFEVKAIKTFGLWDADDNTVQSRVGDYVIILKIKNIGIDE